ncbi:hypothetical protein ACFYM5_26935 [Streptomyces sp. NPDC006706]
MELLEPGRRNLALSRAVPPRQHPGPPRAQQQLVDKGDEGQGNDQPGQGHEEDECHTAIVRGAALPRSTFDGATPMFAVTGRRADTSLLAITHQHHQIE